MADEQKSGSGVAAGPSRAELLASFEGSYYTSVLDFESHTQVLRLGPMPPSPWRVARIYNGLDGAYEPMTLDELATFLEEHKVELPFGATLDDIDGITALSTEDIPTMVDECDEVEIHLKPGRPYPLLPDMAALQLFVRPDEEAPVSVAHRIWRKLIDLVRLPTQQS